MIKTTLLLSTLLCINALSAVVVSTKKLPRVAQVGEAIVINRSKVSTLPRTTLVSGNTTAGYFGSSYTDLTVLHCHYQNGILLIDELNGLWPAWSLLPLAAPGSYLRITVSGAATCTFFTTHEGGIGELLVDWFPKVTNGQSILTDEEFSDLTIYLHATKDAVITLQQVSIN